MRVNALLAFGALAAVSRADVLEDLEDTATQASSSVASVVESVTSSAVSKPTFTVRLSGYVRRGHQALTRRSPPRSRQTSSSSSPTTGSRDGRPLTPRRRELKRSGLTSVPGPSRSQVSSVVLRETRVLSSRTKLPTTPFPPSSPRPWSTKTTPSSFNTRPSSRVSAQSITLSSFNQHDADLSPRRP